MQILLHQMSSVRTVSFQGLLPPELPTAHSTDPQGVFSRYFPYRFKSATANSYCCLFLSLPPVPAALTHHAGHACRRQSSALFGAESQHAADLATSLGGEKAGAAATQGMRGSGAAQSGSSASATHSETESQHEEEEEEEDIAQRSLRRGRELRDVQIVLDRVNKLYKNKSPMVRLPYPLNKTTRCI